MTRTTSRRFSVDLASTYVAGVLSMVSGFVLLPVAAHTVGIEVYGTWLTFAALQQLVFTCDLGLQATVVRFSAKAWTEGGRDAAVAGLWLTGRRAFALLGVVGLATFTLSALLLRSHGELDFDLLSMAVLGVGVFLVGIPARLPLAVLQGIGLYSATAVHLIIGTLLGQSVKVVALLTATAGDVLPWLALGDALTVAVPGLLSLRRLRRETGLSAFGVTAGTVAPTALPRRELLAYAGYSAVLVAGLAILFQANTLLIGLLLSAGAVAVFDGALRVFQGGRRIVDLAIGPLVPWATARLAVGSDSTGRAAADTTVQLWRYAVLPLGAGVAALYAAAPVIVDLWLGERFAEVVPLMRILLVVLLLQVVVVPAFVVRQALGRLRSHTVLTVVWVAVSIPLTVLLVSRYGLVGAALGPLVPQVLLLPAFLLADARRMLGEHWLLPLREMAVVSGVLVLLVGGSGLAADHSSSTSVSGYVLVLAGLAAGAAVLIRGRSTPAEQGAVHHG